MRWDFKPVLSTHVPFKRGFAKCLNANDAIEFWLDSVAVEKLSSGSKRCGKAVYPEETGSDDMTYLESCDG
ncbi:hypothetical protein GcM3_171001, partial [Golovinomyces cichoracearum]